MTKEKNVLDKQKRERMFKAFDDFCLTDDARTYAMQDKPLGFFRAGYEAADALTKPLEGKIAELRAINPCRNMCIDFCLVESLQLRIAELERVYACECEIRNKRGEMLLEANEKIAEQQKELDDCKNAVVMMREELKPYSHYGVIGSRDVNTKRIQLLLSATSAIVEGYKI